ncbi:MAG TPA: PHB depolymerase family esterase [Gammaproteobacteria bacterium]|jgi:dienelactone hydrolase
MHIRSLPLLLLGLLWLPAALADPPPTGAYGTSFNLTTPLADGAEVLKRLLHPLVYDEWQAAGRIKPGQTIDPTKETWKVYVPPDYDGSQAYGVLVWITWGQDGHMEENWQHVFRDHKLIYVGADKSGNDESVVTRRVPLALTGLANIEALYKIDPARIYIAGFSGGGVAASRIAAAYADVFTGGLFVSTSDGIGSPDVPVPPLDRFMLMRSRGRYVFTSGEEETSNLVINARSVDEYRSLCVPRVDYIHIPNATHGNLDSRVFARAMAYLDTPPAVDATAQADCEKKLADRRAQGIEQVRQSLAAGDKDKAWSQLQDVAMAFGPLAEPEFSQLSACISGTSPVQSCVAGKP